MMQSSLLPYDRSFFKRMKYIFTSIFIESFSYLANSPHLTKKIK